MDKTYFLFSTEDCDGKGGSNSDSDDVNVEVDAATDSTDGIIGCPINDDEDSSNKDGNGWGKLIGNVIRLKIAIKNFI